MLPQGGMEKNNECDVRVNSYCNSCEFRTGCRRGGVQLALRVPCNLDGSIRRLEVQ